MIRYLFEFTLCSALFYALYHLLLEGRTAHRAARAYLVVSMLLSLVIPLLELPLYPAQTIYYEVPIALWEDIAATTLPSTTEVATAPAVDWRGVLSRAILIIYMLIVVLNVAVMVRKLWLIHRLRQSAHLSFYVAYTIAESDSVTEPFSFWRTIFLAPRYAPREREQIIAHEASHVRHCHTVERLALEALRCVAWFNPFVWVTATALAQVQEWEADQDVLHQGYDVYEYRQLIFRQLFGYNPDIASGLKSQTSKKRFLMMTNFQKGKLSLVRYGAVIPLVAVMILAFGAVRAEAEVSPKSDVATQSQPQQPDELKAEVYISADGTIRLNGEVVALEDLAERVEQARVEMLAGTSQMVDKATPQSEQPEVYISADGTIKFNGEVVTEEELKERIAKAREEIGVEAVLTIKADENTRVGKINDVKQIARKAKMLRIRYDMPRGAINAILPPHASTNEKVVVVEDYIAHYNLLRIFVNARGKIMTTRPDGTQAVVDLAELKSIIKAFVDNSESVAGKRQVKNKNYSDFTWQTIKRGDGEVHYPVSNGALSLVTTRDLSADRYVEIQATIREAYAELRDELAQRSFHKPFSALEGDDRNYIMQAIPMKVSEYGFYNSAVPQPIN